MLDDRAGGKYARPDRIRPINHRGDFYQVEGRSTCRAPRKGGRCCSAAGSSDTGRRFAARHADAVFTAHMEKATAKEFYVDLKALVKEEGRNPNQTLILPGLSPMIAGTETEARRLAPRGQRPHRHRSRQEAPVEPLRRPRFLASAARRAALRRGLPRSRLVQAARSRTRVIINFVRRENATLRQLLSYLAGARGHFTYAGTPEQVADLMVDWFEDGAADGFNVMPPLFPQMLDAFATEVIPILQRRGCSAPSTRATLRDHYGLDRPPSQYD